MINLETQYPGKITPSSSNYPYGEPRNITTPGDGTGTPWEEAWVKDMAGMQQALLTAASITPTGDPDTAVDSQFLLAIKKISTGSIDFVNDLIGVTGIVGLQTLASDRTVIGDGGGGIFAWESAVDKAGANGGTIVDPSVSLALQGTGVGTGAWVRRYSGEVHTVWFGTKADATISTDGTDDTLAIQATIDSVGSEGDVVLDDGIHTVTQLEIIEGIRFRGSAGNIDADRTILTGAWLKLKDSTGLTTADAILKVTHNTAVTSSTKRTFATLEKFGIYGNRANNTNGNGLIISTKNVEYDSVTIYECPTTGLILKDETGAGNDGANAVTIKNPWIGYNGKYGIDCQRINYSGDLILLGGHVFWNDDAGVYVNQPNVLFLGIHVWWNLDGVIVDGTLAGNGVQFSGARIYDNAAAGVRLINSAKNINFSCDIHGNGNENRWAFFSPPKTSVDIPQNEQAGIFCNTDAKNIIIGNVNFGFLNDTGQQYYGLRNIHANAEFSIGVVSADGATSTQTDRAIVLTDPTKAVSHGTHTKSDMTHVGFIANGDINMNSNDVTNIDKTSYWAWDLVAVASGVLPTTSTTVVVSEAAPVNVNSMTTTVGGQLPMIIIRNGGSNAVTFVHNTSFLRNISGANVVLGQHESIGYIAVSAGVYQQVMGKI